MQGDWRGSPDDGGPPAGGAHGMEAAAPLSPEQVLAAQLQALQLGGAAAQPQPVGVPAPQYGAVAGFAGAQAAGAAGGGRGSPSAAGSHAAPHQLDATFLGCTDLLARLQMGAAVAAAGVPVGGTTIGLPPDALSIQQQVAVAAAMQQQQQQQQLQQQQQPGQQARQGPPGRRRNAAGRRNEEKVRRTIYISDISDAVSEAQLAGFFADCGQLVDCRVCGDPNSSMRFAFIEFVTEEAAQQALTKSGSMLGDFPIRVSSSKTAIVPVNNTYLPRSQEERELVARTIFVGNIDRIVEREQLREFFENLCGPVSKIRLLGDTQHSCKIAFVEFATAESARGALKLSGALLGTLPLRISPSKTPVRIDSRRSGEGQRSTLPQLALSPGAVTALAQANPHLSAAHLNPALLMAVAGFNMGGYPPHFAG